MFRSKKPKPPGPTEILLTNNPNPDIKELLDQEDLSTQFREKNPFLIGFFLGKDEDGKLNMKKIFEHIMETTSREDQKKLFSLYQMSNTCLHRVLADSVEISETAFESVDRENPYKQYAMGVFSRMLSRAIDQWPEENWQVFWNTKGALTKVIENLDSTCIYQAILDCFIQKQHPHISALMWYIFISFVSPEKAKEYLQKPPTFTIFIDPIDLKNNEDLLLELHGKLKKYHKLNLISLLIEYFKCSLDKIEEFQEIFLDYVANAKEEEVNEIENGTLIEFYPRLFEIARIIKPNQLVIKKALEIIRESNDTSSLKVQYCAQYLSICSEILEEKVINEIIDILLNENSKQFTITAILKLISFTIEDHPKWVSFKKSIIEKVIKLWQKLSNIHLTEQNSQNTSPNGFLLLDSILTIGRIIYNSEVNNIIQKYIPEKTKNEKKDDDDEYSDDFSEENEDKPDPNKDPKLLKEISEIGSNWENWDEFKQQVINWSQQDFIEPKKTATLEEKEKNIVINFDDGSRAQTQEQDQNNQEFHNNNNQENEEENNETPDVEVEDDEDD